MRTREFMAYAAVIPGVPGFVAISVDEPQYAADNATEVAKWIRKGWRVERVSGADAIVGFNLHVDAKRAQREFPQSVLPLFADVKELA